MIRNLFDWFRYVIELVLAGAFLLVLLVMVTLTVMAPALFGAICLISVVQEIAGWLA